MLIYRFSAFQKIAESKDRIQTHWFYPFIELWWPLIIYEVKNVMTIIWSYTKWVSMPKFTFISVTIKVWYHFWAFTQNFDPLRKLNLFMHLGLRIYLIALFGIFSDHMNMHAKIIAIPADGNLMALSTLTARAGCRTEWGKKFCDKAMVSSKDVRSETLMRICKKQNVWSVRKAKIVSK